MHTAVDRVLRHFVPKLDDHLSDEGMASLFGRELPFAKRWIAERHLARCLHCRTRKDGLEGPRAERMLELYHDAYAVAPPPAGRPRAAFAHWLELQSRHAAPSQTADRQPTVLSWLRGFSALPAASVGMASGLAIAVSFFAGWQHRLPRITANALLVRAETAETPVPGAHPGVVRQTVRIQSPTESIERSIYWDLQRRRRPKRVTLPGDEEQLRSKLDRAGIDWDQPISASTYQAWHDHQHVRSDRITRAGRHLLTLTTSVPDGIVAEESLTVRDTDFHPVSRKVDFRDSGTVEIAELDFEILPWNSVDAGVFEPMGGTSPAVAITLPRVHSSLRLPEMPSLDQLDETELGARLILNHLHADAGEQIEIARSPQGIQVEGVVDTDGRKRELQTQLMTVPRLKVSLHSMAELKNQRSLEDVVRVQTAALPDQPSSLEIYLKARGRGVEEMNLAAQELFHGALAISQESHGMLDLGSRFVPSEQAPVASATLAELLYSHHERLEAALEHQRALLVQIEGGSAAGSEPAAALSLADAAARNLALAKELTQTNTPAARSAEAIFAEMSANLGTLAVAAREAYAASQDDPVLDGKK